MDFSWLQTEVGGRFLRVTSYLAISALFALIILFSFGDRLEDMTGIAWLGAFHNDGSGLYVDCKKRSNKNNPYCTKQRAQTVSEKSWNDLSHGKGATPPFTLW